jgi:hypothetical protein
MLGFVIASTITLLIVRTVRRAQRKAEEARLAAEAEAQRKAEEARLAAEAEAQRKAEEARLAAEAEAQRKAEEARLAAEAEAQRKAEEARLAAEAEAQRKAEEARLAAEAEAQRKAEEARLAAEAEAQRKAEEARLAAEAEAQRKAEEARLAAEAEAQRKAEETHAAIRTPRQYEPVARVPTFPATPHPRGTASADRETRDRALPVCVRLVFERAGFCRVSLLPRRAPGMPSAIMVSGSGDPPELLALQDEWYQDVFLPNTANLLKKGIEWAGALSEGQHVRWSLSGRELYVLAPHDELNGFVNVPRIVLGGQHVVLCLAERLQEVRSAIALTGSPEPMPLDSENGMPTGWIGLRGVVPHTPVEPSTGGDILDALCPLAEVEIWLEGGIRIDRQTWLSGFPPLIRLRGDTRTIGAIVIDGVEATLSQEGGYVTPGWDSLGDHSVWCTAGSRNYSIREGAEDWEPWDAYRWSHGEAVTKGVAARPAICGVLVRPPRLARAQSRPILVPASNPVLIGAVPGEVEFCMVRRDVRHDVCMGFPWFAPVWAIPADPLHCDKRNARVLLAGAPRPVVPVEPGLQHKRRAHSSDLHAWCIAIRMAGRKGLQTEPQGIDIADLWKAYKQRAKELCRSMP